MKNVLVCVTQQKTCERLIRYGKEMIEGTDSELMVVHIAQYDLGKLGETDDARSLEYLYQKALEYGANLTLVRSGNVAATLVSMIDRNDISVIVMGETRKANDEDSTIQAFKSMLHEDVRVIVVPENDDTDDNV